MAKIGFTQNENAHEYVPFPAGTFPFVLAGLFVEMNPAGEYQGKAIPATPAFTFEWRPADEPEGDLLRWKRVSVPKGFRYNEKSKLYQIVGALIGRPFTEADVAKLEMEFESDAIASYDDLYRAVDGEEKKVAESGKEYTVPLRARLKAFEFDGASLIGRGALLTLEEKPVPSDPSRTYNKVAGISALPSAAPTRRKSVTGSAPS